MNVYNLTTMFLCRTFKTIFTNRKVWICLPPLLCLAGCAQFTFEVVDEDSHRPLQSVSIHETSVNAGWFDFEPHSVTFPPTGPEGKVTTDMIRTDFQNFFTFEKDGYHEGAALITSQNGSLVGGYRVSDDPRVRTTTRVVIDGKMVTAEEDNYYFPLHPDVEGIYIIPLRMGWRLRTATRPTQR